MAKKLKLKKRGGSIIDLPISMVKSILSKAGYTGKHLTLMTTGVVKEAGKLATAGVVSTVHLEKAIVRAAFNTNKLLMNNTKKIVKKVLK